LSVIKIRSGRTSSAPFHAYSPSGETEGQVVYANYGLPEDYEKLDELGVVVRDRIVLVRYGQAFRGVKVNLAEEHKARAVLIYSDPADDGYMQGDVYPYGPMRPESGIQRGSVQYLFIYPGDPLTPGWAATGAAERNAPSGAKTTAYSFAADFHGDAEKFAKSRRRTSQRLARRLALAYHVGPGLAALEVKVVMDYQVRSDLERRRFAARQRGAGKYRADWQPSRCVDLRRC
jgi:N-acetylated-alpha-linked acidic dipeptidase